MIMPPTKIKVFKFSIFTAPEQMNKELMEFAARNDVIHSVSTAVNDVTLFVTVVYQES